MKHACRQSGKKCSVDSIVDNSPVNTIPTSNTPPHTRTDLRQRQFREQHVSLWWTWWLLFLQYFFKNISNLSLWVVWRMCLIFWLFSTFWVNTWILQELNHWFSYDWLCVNIKYTCYLIFVILLITNAIIFQLYIIERESFKFILARVISKSESKLKLVSVNIVEVSVVHYPNQWLKLLSSFLPLYTYLNLYCYIVIRSLVK